MATRIQVRRGTSSQWNEADPILTAGEFGFNTTLGQIKIGDGISTWSQLDYMATDDQLNSSLANYIELTEKGAGDGVAELDSEKNVLTRQSVIFEGATTNSFQTTVSVVEPTVDNAISIPNTSGTVVTTGNLSDITAVGTLTGLTINGDLFVTGTTTTIDTQHLLVEDKNITIGDVATPTDTTADGGGITLKGTTDKTFNWVDATDSWTSSENLNLASGKTVKINGTDVLTSNQVLGKSLPSGDVVGTSDTQTLTNKTLNTPTLHDATFTGQASGLEIAFNQTIVFEGTTADTNELTLSAGNPTADRTVTLPDATDTLVGKATTDTLSNKSIDLGSNTVTGTLAQFNTALSDADFASLAGTETLSNKTIALGSNTVSGTVAQFNTALTDGDFATLAGAETLTNKTLTSPTITGLFLNDSSIVFEGSSEDANETTLTVTNPTADRTITLPDVTGTVVTTGDSGTITSTMIADGTIVDADINASAAIDKTKISGTAITAADTGTVTSTMIADGTIVDGDINASAAIAISKLAASTISGVSLGNNLNTLTIGTGLSGTSYNGSSAVTVAIDSTVATTSGTQTLTNKTVALGSNTVSGTLSEFNAALTDADFATLTGAETLTNKTLGSTTTLGANLNANSNKITSLGTPTAATDAATKQYVDDLAQGLHIHASTVTATTSNLTASYDNGSSGDGATLTNSGAQAALVIDGVTLSTSDRVLVKNQTTQLENGIYTVTNTGSTSTNWVLTRATDMNQSVEVNGGDFVFVTGGTANDNTGWVQVETGVTIGTSSIVFTQFSGAGTYQAGTGLTLTGNTFSINTATTVDLNTAQTLTNKTIALGSNTVSGTLAQFNTALTDADFASLAGVETLTNKTVNLSSNTLTGTVAQFNTALSDGDFATLAGTETLTNKTLTSPVISTITNSGTLTLPTSTDTIVGRATTDTLTNKSISLGSNTVTGTLAQFNTALSDADFASLSGTETLTNKTVKETLTASVTSNSAVTVDTNAMSSFTSIQYIVSIKQGSKIRTSTLNVQTDGTSVDFVEYGTIQTGGAMTGFAISATTSSTNQVLNITITDASSTNATVKIFKVVM